jgi:hypothetical protein
VSAGLHERIGDLFDGDMPDDADWLSLLIKNKLDILPMPGEGSTLDRWRALAAVGKFDLSLTKLYEGHTDALAIMEEIDLDGVELPAGSWCVWAAEGPGGRAIIDQADYGGVVLSGAKFWCSGAASADHALLTAWERNGSGPHLVAVKLDQPGIAIDSEKWKAVGMASSMSLNVAFDGVKARRVGKPGEYLSRPGFWHGGAGIAACWHGGAVGLASALRKSLLASNNDPAGLKLGALGKVDLAIEETAAVLRQAARWIDDHPLLDASRVALTTRLSAERCAKTVLDEVGKAMGAIPFCLDEKFAKAAADLPVFVRQSHGDRDFTALGERSLKAEMSWTL